MSYLKPLDHLTERQIAWAKEKIKRYDMNSMREYLCRHTPSSIIVFCGPRRAEKWIEDKLIELTVEAAEPYEHAEMSA